MNEDAIKVSYFHGSDESDAQLDSDVEVLWTCALTSSRGGGGTQYISLTTPGQEASEYSFVVHPEPFTDGQVIYYETDSSTFNIPIHIGQDRELALALIGDLLTFTGSVI